MMYRLYFVKKVTICLQIYAIISIFARKFKQKRRKQCKILTKKQEISTT